MLKSEKGLRAIEIDVVEGQAGLTNHIEQAVKEIASGGSLIITTPDERRESAEQVSKTFGQAVSQICCSASVGTLILIGDDTAESVCEMLDLFGIEITGELEDGIPVGSIIGGALNGVSVVTKAGGSGKEDALLRLWELAEARG